MQRYSILGALLMVFVAHCGASMPDGYQEVGKGDSRGELTSRIDKVCRRNRYSFDESDCAEICNKEPTCNGFTFVQKKSKHCCVAKTYISTPLQGFCKGDKGTSFLK
eukprot:gene1574-32959_t